MGFFLTLFLFTGVTILAELLRPKPQIENARPAGLGDFNFPTATQGRVVPLVWGRVMVDGPNVVWYGDLKQTAITEKVKTGLFSSTTIVKGYQYNIGIQFALARGSSETNATLHKILIGEKEIFNGSIAGIGTSTDINEPLFYGGDDVGQGGIIGTFRWYPGLETQTTNSYISSFQQQGGDTPAYRGTAYGVWEGGYIGNSENIRPWAFEISRYPDGLSLGSGANINLDANPANVAYEALTNTDWGLGVPASDIETADFSSAGSAFVTEDNGFSFLLDGPMEASNLIEEIERQTDSVIYLDRLTGKWRMRLIRGGTDIDTVPQLTDTNTRNVEEFTRGSWDDTTNEIRVGFNNRDISYGADYATAQDDANLRIVGERAAAEVSYPGVKRAAVANSIVWRELRSLSRPLAKGTVIVDRTFWNTSRGDLLAWTNTELGFTKQPMRVNRVDLGDLDNNNIRLNLVEDVFTFDSPAYADPDGTGWTAPVNTPVDIPSASRLIIEPPKAFTDRDPLNPGLADRIWAGARSQGVNELLFDIEVSGAIVGTVNAFLLKGAVSSQIARLDNGNTIAIKAGLDTITAINAVMATVTEEDIGVSLSNLMLVGSEWMAFTGATTGDPVTTLTGVRRGLLDSAVATHAVDADVWLVFVGGGLTEDTFAIATHQVKLLPQTNSSQLASGSASQTPVTLANRALKPYPPARLDIAGTVFPTTAQSIDTAITIASRDPKGYDFGWVRRDFRTTNEVTAQNDETTLPSDFPTVNNTRYQTEIRNDPDGSNTLLLTRAYQNAQGVALSRSEILRATNSVVPTRIRFEILTRHTLDSVDRDADQNAQLDIDVSSTELSGSTAIANKNYNQEAEIYASAPSTGNYTVNVDRDVFKPAADLLVWSDDMWLSWSDNQFIGWKSLTQGAFDGALQLSLNDGAFTDLIASGELTKTFAVTAGDKVELRSTIQGDDVSEALVRVQDPVGGNKRHFVAIL